MNRRQIREEFFKLIYELHFYRPEEFEEQIEYFLENESIDVSDDDDDDGDSEPITIASGDSTARPERKLADFPQASAEIRERIEGILSHYKDIDRELTERTEGWTLDRIGTVELALLRLCIYEISFEGLAKGIAINEAVELAKKYGGESSGSFVNGVMARVVKNAGD